MSWICWFICRPHFDNVSFAQDRIEITYAEPDIWRLYVQHYYGKFKLEFDARLERNRSHAVVLIIYHAGRVANMTNYKRVFKLRTRTCSSQTNDQKNYTYNLFNLECRRKASVRNNYQLSYPAPSETISLQFSTLLQTIFHFWWMSWHYYISTRRWNFVSIISLSCSCCHFCFQHRNFFLLAFDLRLNNRNVFSCAVESQTNLLLLLFDRHIIIYLEK